MSIQNINAISAYNKAQKAMSGLRHSQEAEQKQLNILRQGDNIEVVAKPEKSEFAAVLTQVIEPELRKIKKADEMTSKAFVPGANGMVNGPDLVNFVTSLNEAQASVEKIVAIRDKFISAYMDIIKMPI